MVTERQRAWRVARKARWKKEGVCTRCGRARAPGVEVCQKCRAYNKAALAKYRPNMPPKVRERQRVGIAKWHKENRARCNALSRASYRKMRLLVLRHYGEWCACCKERGLQFLTIDHINGGGTKHVAGIKTTFYNWLRRNGFPTGFQTLCWNCNAAKHIYGTCPHKLTKAAEQL